jgi:hypothetical protein
MRLVKREPSMICRLCRELVSFHDGVMFGISPPLR